MCTHYKYIVSKESCKTADGNRWFWKLNETVRARQEISFVLRDDRKVETFEVEDVVSR